MAILGYFEVQILQPTYEKDHLGEDQTTWTPMQEYDPPGSSYRQTPGSDLETQAYIGIPDIHRLLYDPGWPGPLFAIDFRTKCGFKFDSSNAKYLVYRVYLDDVKIGSSFVKRDRWERSGSYRVRKTGRRFYSFETDTWTRRPWAIDSGIHGTIRVEVWRQTDKAADIGSCYYPEMEDPSLGALFVDLTGEDEGVNTRVRHTAKVDSCPLATFNFEYRSEETMRDLGLMEALPVRRMPICMPEPVVSGAEAQVEAETSNQAVPTQAMLDEDEEVRQILDQCPAIQEMDSDEQATKQVFQQTPVYQNSHDHEKDDRPAVKENFTFGKPVDHGKLNEQAARKTSGYHCVTSTPPDQSTPAPEADSFARTDYSSFTRVSAYDDDIEMIWATQHDQPAIMDINRNTQSYVDLTMCD